MRAPIRGFSGCGGGWFLLSDEPPTPGNASSVRERVCVADSTPAGRGVAGVAGTRGREDAGTPPHEATKPRRAPSRAKVSQVCNCEIPPADSVSAAVLAQGWVRVPGYTSVLIYHRDPDTVMYQ